MKHAWALILLALFTASAACRAADNDAKQLAKTHTYEKAMLEAMTGSGSLPAAADSATKDQTYKLVHEFYMRREEVKLYEIAILSALALVSLFIVLRFITTKAAYSASHIVNATGLVFIIFGTILLVIMADTDEQLTAPIGILGAVAGYLFGSINRGKSGTETGEEK